MSQELILAGALANTSGFAKTEDLTAILVKEIPVYKLRPAEPGFGMKAALDWQAVLNVTSNLITIGNLLWMAYDRLIKPIKEKNSKSDAFLFVQIKTTEGKFVQFSLGKDFKDKEAFIQEFNRAASELRSEPSSISGESAQKQIEESGAWVRIW